MQHPREPFAPNTSVKLFSYSPFSFDLNMFLTEHVKQMQPASIKCSPELFLVSISCLWYYPLNANRRGMLLTPATIREEVGEIAQSNCAFVQFN